MMWETFPSDIRVHARARRDHCRRLGSPPQRRTFSFGGSRRALDSAGARAVPVSWPALQRP
eukprot:11785002-Alexandrium_andersonii.AAC.1